MTTLTADDILWATRVLPRAVKDAMKKHGNKIVVAGGFLRASIARETINDVDLFVPDAEFGRQLASELSEGNQKKVHQSENALTIFGHKYTIQVITRWTFHHPSFIVPSFDFTIARAAMWWEPSLDSWQSLADERFYPDLAAKRLIYCNPERNEDAGGSMLRLLKFYSRGYTAPLSTVAGVMGRMLTGVPEVNFEKRGCIRPGDWEKQMGQVLTGLLREVDPQIDPDHIAHIPGVPSNEQESEGEDELKIA